ncbi:TIGR01777 family protein [Skermania sp. ID1734]|uniref:TIGR01777 family oxidoreductase n=1 Tax=Skermania sp. ID1734 TaxID=2597516 RepID=UPI001180FAE2|nr:TIGR01777 family oxidoreductase [Skermania sp. ID1734]TSE00456.1 TIGR01777 family protein [Skermania sp. ID1734]
MSIIASSVLDFPCAEVFAWHARPGAIVRLMPPWQPLKVIREAESLRDGRAVIGLPLGARWVATHDPSGYAPPHQFVDVSPLLRWRHTHRFEEAGANQCRITDHVDTIVPASALTSTFDFRHRQLADDLAAHRSAAHAGLTPKTVAITGSSGLVGTALAAFLSTGGHRVIKLVRRAPRTEHERRWDPENPAPDLLSGIDVVIHLAGASIAGRFTDAHKAAIRDSRVAPTRALAQVAARTATKPAAFVSASAIGFYGPDRGAETLTENSNPGDGLLADLVADWEAATQPAADAGIRCVQVRTGIVQSARGGMLGLVRPLFTAGLGGRLGDGRQWMSWIDLDDLVDIYHRAIYDTDLSGPVNGVAPQPLRNTDYTRTLGRTLHRPTLLPVPSFGPRILLGADGADELALANQRVIPAKLIALGHTYRRPDLADSLGHQLGRR